MVAWPNTMRGTSLIWYIEKIASVTCCSTKGMASRPWPYWSIVLPELLGNTRPRRMNTNVIRYILRYDSALKEISSNWVGFTNYSEHPVLTYPFARQQTSRLISQRRELVFNSFPLDKMAAISETTFSNAFSWMEMLEFWFKLHWNLSLRDNNSA